MSTQLRFHPQAPIQKFTDPDSISEQPASIILLSMPFGLPYMPSLGLSLLKGGLATRGIAADVRYLGMSFAQTIGYSFYQRMAHSGAGDLGDWLFYQALYGPPSASQTERFWQLAYADRSPRGMAPSFEALQEKAAQMQGQACTFIDHCLHEIDWVQYRLVGFTSMFQQNFASLALARRIKEIHPHVQILFGGPNAEGDMGAALMACFPFIDFVFSGESDNHFPAFAEAVLADEPNLPLAGIISRETPGGAVRRPASWGEPIDDMDALPYPNFDDFYDQFNAAFPELQPHINYETARGCWWGEKSHCTFCGLNSMGMAYRSKSPDRAIEEIDFLNQRYMSPNRVTLMQPSDEILDLRYFDSVIPRLPKAAPGIPTFFEIKANLKREQIKALAQSNVKLVQPGIENLSSRVLKLMRKGCTLLQNIQLLKWCAEFGVFPIWLFLYGFPGEREADYQHISEIVPLITHLQPPKKPIAIELDRFSPYFTSPEALGVTNLRPPELISLFYPFEAQHQYDICYTFDFDYMEPRDATTYLGTSVERLTRLWIQTRQRGALVGFYDADRLLIWDSRLGAVDPWVEVHGPYRDALLQADRILAENRLQTWLADAFGPADGEVAWDDFLACMEPRGWVLREDGRVLSLVVLHAVSEHCGFPEVPADQVVHVAPDLNHGTAVRSLGFGGAVIDDVLAGPPDDSDRCRVALRGRLFRLAPEGTMDGVCVVESSWGTSVFRLSGALHMGQGERTRLEVTAERISGFDAGPWKLAFESDDLGVIDTPESCISGHAHYADAVNPFLQLRMEIDGLTSPVGADDIHFRATGDGFYFASFFAEGTSVGGSEIV